MDKIRTIDDSYRDPSASRMMDELVRDLVAGKTKHVGEATKQEISRLYARLRSQGMRLRYQQQTVDGVSGYVMWAIAGTGPETDPQSELQPEQRELVGATA
jgi:hypothetical protein